MDIFDTCQKANEFLIQGKEKEARNELIQLLDEIKETGEEYPELLNQMLREAGLYPYMQESSASWDQRFLLDAFSSQTGLSRNKRYTLHREQSRVLRLLLEGRSVSVSAPTSFGKSFIVDAFIARKKPRSVMIIVPTIALMDEMRRRLYKNFGGLYKIITTTDADPADYCIYVFPQERALSYVGRIAELDLLIIDEFYKISSAHDKERSSALYKAALKLSNIARQRYFLSPNISHLEDNPITDNMDFLELLNFNTVYLKKHNYHRSIKRDLGKKFETLERVIASEPGKTLIYAGTYSEINRISNWIREHIPASSNGLRLQFSDWLKENYTPEWQLPHLVERGAGVHNGSMHRCLSQLQVKLFEEPEGGIDFLTSTSSIIEGVNTSAQTVVIWKNKVGPRNLTSFSYKNIIGRGGRMFKHFVGDIHILENPPEEKDTQLEIKFPKKILGSLDAETDRNFLSEKQRSSILRYDEEMSSLVGIENYRAIKSGNLLSDTDSDFLLELARSMKSSPSDWNGFGYLNSNRPSDWDSILYKILRLKPGAWEGRYSDTVAFIHLISQNWNAELKDVLRNGLRIGVDVEKFFNLERLISYKLSSLISDANVLHRHIINNGTDVTPFATRVGYGFLPKLVYQLEEAGLPRMISRKIHYAGLFDMQATEVPFSRACEFLANIGAASVIRKIEATQFESFIIEYFMDGITPDPIESSAGPSDGPVIFN